MKNQLAILGIIAITLYTIWMFCGDKKIPFWRTWRYLVEWGFFTGVFVIAAIHFNTTWQLMGYAICIWFGLLMTVFHIVMINKTPIKFSEYLNYKGNLSEIFGIGFLIVLIVIFLIGNWGKIWQKVCGML